LDREARGEERQDEVFHDGRSAPWRRGTGLGFGTLRAPIVPPPASGAEIRDPGASRLITSLKRKRRAMREALRLRFRLVKLACALLYFGFRLGSNFAA
jgi:hypothetical protein